MTQTDATNSSGVVSAGNGGKSPAAKRCWFILRALISILLLAAIVRQVGDDALIASLQRGMANWGWLLAAMIVPRIIGTVISTVRWLALLRAQNTSATVGDVVRALMIGAFLNYFLPTSIGGDGYRMWHITNATSCRYSVVLATMLVERGTGLLAMCVLAIVGGLYRWEWMTSVPAIGACVAGCGVLLVAGVVFLIVIKPPSEKLGDGPLGVIRRWRKLAGAMADFRDRPSALWIAFAYSLALQLNIVFQYWAFAKCVEIDITFDRFLIVVPINTIATMIPISFNGIGVREWATIWVCAPLGVASADAALIAVLFIASGLFLAAIGAFLLNQRMAWMPTKTGVQSEST